MSVLVNERKILALAHFQCFGSQGLLLNPYLGRSHQRLPAQPSLVLPFNVKPCCLYGLTDQQMHENRRPLQLISHPAWSILDV